METDNLTKFRKIVAGLEPDKREALMARMKGMSKEEAMVMVDRMVELSEQRKIEITARPKVLAGSGREVSVSRTDYEVRRPSTYTEIPEDRNIEIVKNPGRRVAAPSNFKPAQHPVKRAEPAVATARRDDVAREIEYRQRLALLEQEKKARKNALIKKVLRISGKYLGRVMATAVLTLVLVLAGFYTFLGIIMKGPSPHLRNQFVPSVMESSAGGVLARMILTDEEIDSIMNSNKTQGFEEITDTTLVNAMAAEQKKKAEANAAAVNELDPDGDGIEVHDVSGPMYHGKMLVIYDPSRIMVATIDNYNHNGAGLTLKQLIDKYGGVGGINGGQYEDKNGMGIGGWPEGIVISEGKLRMGSKNGTYEVYGLTNENVLVVGRMTAQKALDIGVRDAVSFGPALIVNGVAAKYSGAGGGLNPRTAIGQREDGAILLLVIEGRKTSSMGATMADLIKVMQDYGAVNAANLDGGMSSAMWLYDDELVSSSSVRVSRQMPTAFIILPQKNDASNAGQ